MRRSIYPVLLVALIGVPALAQGDRELYEVSFPDVRLRTAKEERIESVKVVMRCGRFVAVNSIPDDWSAEVVSPVSEVTTLKMEAGHGTSELWHSSALNGFITVWMAERSCFYISASLLVGYYEVPTEHERRLSFKRRDLILKRVDAKATPNEESKP
jgi:hypothetical protein